MITNQDRKAIRRIFRKTAEEAGPQAAQLAASLPERQRATAIKAIVAQNALRVCLEVVYEECMPFDENLCGEIAVRMASYAISMAPIERQEALLEAVMGALPGAHARRLKDRITLLSTWETPHGEQPNAPKEGGTH